LPLTTNSAISVPGGYTLPIYSERQISDCRNCTSEKVEIDGGLSGQVGVHYGIGNVNFESYILKTTAT